MLAKFFIDRPIFAWVIAIIILLGGALALRKLPVAAYPEVAPPAISVNISYPGASAQVVEDTTVTLIEEQLSGVEHLLYMESSSELGRATITLTFDTGTDLDVASVETQNRIKSTEARLPQEVQRAGITVRKSARNYLMFVALISPDHSMDNVALGSYAASNVLDQILRVPGVGDATLFGTEQRRIAHTRHAQYLVEHVGRRIAAECNVVHAVIGRNQRNEHQVVARRFAHGDAGALHFLRQPGLGALDAVLGFHRCHVEIGAGVESQGDGGAPQFGGRLHVQQVLDAAELLLDQRHGGVFHHLRRRAGIADVDGNCRRRHLGIGGHRQLAQGQRTTEQDDDRDHPGKDGAIDEEFG